MLCIVVCSILWVAPNYYYFICTSDTYAAGPPDGLISVQAENESTLIECTFLLVYILIHKYTQ